MQTPGTLAVSSKAILRTGLPYLTSAVSNPYALTGKWLTGVAGMIVGMIHVGGITRLTQSGLSMTSWTFLGSMPPRNEKEWLEEFARYQSFPEFEQRRHTMTLRDFKYIFWWEYSHRMLGRLVGVCFFVPWAGLTLAGKIPTGYQPRLMGLFILGGTQGVVGWWMVKSGLGEDRRGDRKEIRVQPPRLATHLTLAAITYSAVLWTALDIFSLPHAAKSTATNAFTSGNFFSLNQDAVRQVSRLRQGSLLLTLLAGLSITSGALVAGNDAGRAFNTFPKMDGYWIPPELWSLHPWQRNFYENTATVQWNHRVLASSTAVTALTLLLVGLRQGKSTAAFTPQVRQGLYAVGVATTGQAALGVTTLLTYVPLPLAAAHQLGSIAVLSSSLYLLHSLRYASTRITSFRSAASAAAAITNTASKVVK